MSKYDEWNQDLRTKLRVWILEKVCRVRSSTRDKESIVEKESSKRA